MASLYFSIQYFFSSISAVTLIASGKENIVSDKPFIICLPTLIYFLHLWLEFYYYILYQNMGIKAKSKIFILNIFYFQHLTFCNSFLIAAIRCFFIIRYPFFQSCCSNKKYPLFEFKIRNTTIFFISFDINLSYILFKGMSDFLTIQFTCCNSPYWSSK